MGQWADWGETKRKHIEWILGWLCDLHLSPHPPLDLGFSRSTFEEAVYPKGRVTWYGSNSKGMRVQWCTFATSLWLTRGSSSPVGHRDIGDNMGLCSPLNTDGAVDVLAPNVFYHSIKCDNFCQAIFSQSENNYSQFWPISIQLQQPMRVEGIGNVATWLVQNEPFWLVHVWVWNNGVDYKTRLWAPSVVEGCACFSGKWHFNICVCWVNKNNAVVFILTMWFSVCNISMFIRWIWILTSSICMSFTYRSNF